MNFVGEHLPSCNLMKRPNTFFFSSIFPMRLLLGGNILCVHHSLYTQLNFGSTLKCFSEYLFILFHTTECLYGLSD